MADRRTDRRTDRHYLLDELETLVATDPSIFAFLRRASLDGMWYWDLENPEHEWISPEFWELFGIDPAEKSHNPAEWQAMIFPEDRELALENFQRHCADPNHAYDQIVRYRHADGSTVWVRCRGLAIRDEHGTPIRMFGAHNDYTAIKRSEEATIGQLGEQLLDQVHKTERVNRDLEHFIHMAAHDLREPCRRQLALTDLLLEEHGDEVGPALRSQLERISEQAEAMLSIVTGFRVLAELSQPESEPSVIDFNTMAAARLAAAGIDPGHDHIRVDFRHPGQGYDVLLSVLFDHLIQNAVRHGSSPPVIDMFSEEEG